MCKCVFGYLEEVNEIFINIGGRGIRKRHLATFLQAVKNEISFVGVFLFCSAASYVQCTWYFSACKYAKRQLLLCMSLLSLCCFWYRRFAWEWTYERIEYSMLELGLIHRNRNDSTDLGKWKMNEWNGSKVWNPDRRSCDCQLPQSAEETEHKYKILFKIKLFMNVFYDLCTQRSPPPASHALHGFHVRAAVTSSIEPASKNIAVAVVYGELLEGSRIAIALYTVRARAPRT